MREAITFVFRGVHHGIYRAIPVRQFRGGYEWALRVEDVHVFDESLTPLRMEVAHPGRYVRIRAWVPGAVDTTRTITIFYRVRRGLLAWDDADELYWNVTGSEWDAPIRVAEAYVAAPRVLPEAQVRAIAYTGPPGATGSDYTEEWAENFITFRTARPLRPREGLTIAVAWPRGYLARPSRLQEARWFLGDNWPFGLPLLTLALMLGIWQAWGRGPGLSRSIKPEYEPPKGLVPAEAGALVDEQAHPRDVVATLVDLAVRGYLHIEQVTNAFGETDFLFKRLKPGAGDPTLKPLEVFVLAQLFREDWSLNLRLLSEVKRDYDCTLPPIQHAIYRTMVSGGLFPVSPERVRAIWHVIGLALLGIGSALFLADPDWLGPYGWPLPAGVGVSGIVVLALARIMPRRSPSGVQALASVRGFQDFLERAEKDRLERLPADTMHRWLPWAIALGVTDRWIINFQGLKVDPPTWYTGLDPFSLGGFQRDVAAFGSKTQDAIMTTRRASGDSWSGGSGFSGGSSGGGMGGGGGGTF